MPSKIFIFIVLSLSVLSCKTDTDHVVEDKLENQTIVFDGAKAQGRVWVQKEFVLSTFRGVPEDQSNFAQAISNLKEAGFNYVETAWRKTKDTKAILAECDRQGGIKVIAQDNSLIGGFAWFNIKPYHQDSVTRFLDQFGNYKSFAGAYVYDEPKHEQFHIVKNNIDDFERRRPDILGFCVLLQSYSPWYKWDDKRYVSFDKYVDKYMDEVAPAVLSFDYYPMHSTTTNESFAKDNFWRDMSYMRKKALEKNAIFWFYYQGVAEGTLTQEYLGAKGLQSFCANYVVVDSLGRKGSMFEDIKRLNHDIAAIGNTLLCLSSKAVYHGCSMVNDPYADSISQSKYISYLPEYISVGEFVDINNNNYLLVLNRNFIDRYAGGILLKDKFRIYKCGDSDVDKYVESNVLNVELDAGYASLYRLEDISKEPKALTYVVE